MLGKCLGLGKRPVGDQDRRRFGVEQRPDDAAGGAAGTENQDICILELQPEIALQVPHQPDTVGVVAVDAVFAEDQRVHGAGIAGALAQFVDQADDLALVRYGDVESLAARPAETLHGRLEFRGRNLEEFVAHVLPGLQGEQFVNDGRTAVGYRVAHDAVTIGIVHSLIRPSSGQPR